jgi:hypothetical protein
MGNVKIYAARVFFVILYAEDSIPFIKRQDHRFAIEVKSFNQYADLAGKDMMKVFESLSNLGWVYNFRKEGFHYRFSVRLPNWVELSEIGRMTNRYVPLDPKFNEDNSKVDYHTIKEISINYKANKKILAEMVTVEEGKDHIPTVEEVLGDH